jgi:predicted DNA-binding transcriptional regulator AlpA
MPVTRKMAGEFQESYPRLDPYACVVIRRALVSLAQRGPRPEVSATRLGRPGGVLDNTSADPGPAPDALAAEADEQSLAARIALAERLANPPHRSQPNEALAVRLNDLPAMIPAAKAAALLSVSVRTLWRLVAASKFPAPVRYNRKLVWWQTAAVLGYVEE